MENQKESDITLQMSMRHQNGGVRNESLTRKQWEKIESCPSSFRVLEGLKNIIDFNKAVEQQIYKTWEMFPSAKKAEFGTNLEVYKTSINKKLEIFKSSGVSTLDSSWSKILEQYVKMNKIQTLGSVTDCLTGLNKDNKDKLEKYFWYKIKEILGLLRGETKIEDPTLAKGKTKVTLSGALKLQYPRVIKKLESFELLTTIESDKYQNCISVKLRELSETVHNYKISIEIDVMINTFLSNWDKPEERTENIFNFIEGCKKFKKHPIISELNGFALRLRSKLIPQDGQKTINMNKRKIKIELEENAKLIIKAFISIRDLLETIDKEWLKEDIYGLVNYIISDIKHNLFSVLLKNEFLIKSTIKQKINLFSGQKKVCDIVRSDDPYLICLSLTQAEGKTTLASLLHQASGKKIIYCCIVDEVYMNVAQESYFLNTPPVMVSGGAGKYRVIPSFKIHRNSFSSDDEEANIYEYMSMLNSRANKPNMFIVDLKSLDWFLEVIREQSDEYLLFIDEPTMYSDVPGHKIPELMGGHIFKNLLRHTILSSATLPKMEFMQPVIEHWLETWECEEKHIHEISASGTNNSLSIICSETGRMYLPHFKCKSKTEFVRFIEDDFEGRPIFRKSYTGPAVYEMIKLMKKLEIEFIEPKDFFDLNTITLATIRTYAKHLLERISEKDEEIIINFCSQTYDVGLDPLVDIDTAITTYSGKLPGLTLMAVDEPKTVGVRMVAPLAGSMDLKNICKQMDRAEVVEEKKARSMEKMKREERTEVEERDRDRVLTMYIKEEDIIHSRRHLSKYCVSDLPSFHHRFFRYSPSDSMIKDVCQLPNFEWEKQGLLSGVVHTDIDKSSNYYEMVSPLILQGKVPFVLVDNDYTYGVHSAASNAIVTPEFVAGHSQGTLEQYVNRIGRSEECGNGNVFMPISGIEKLFGEADNMEGLILREHFLS